MTRAMMMVLIAGCGGSGSEAPAQVSDDEERLAQAMCDDLSDGFSMFQMHSQAVEFYRDGRSEDAAQLAAAEVEDLATRAGVPGCLRGDHHL